MNSANYLPNHLVGGYSSCDVNIAMFLTTNQPLAGESFNSAYDCSGKSDAIKTMVTSIAENGCCGPNGQSTCAAAPPTDTNQNKGNTTTGIESSATTALSNVFAVSFALVLAIWLDYM